MKTAYIAILTGAVCFLLGCKPADFAEANVVNQARQFFPLADVSHPHQGVLEVNTHVDNVSEMFAAKVMSQLIIEHQSELQFLPVVGYSVLAVSFGQYTCGWNTENQFFVCGDSVTPVHRYSFYGTPLVNGFTPMMPPPPPFQ